MLLCGCSETGDAVTGVKLDKASLSMAVSESKTLTATVEPSAVANQTVIWSSSNPSVATVSDTGLVTATGTATVTATSADNPAAAASCAVTVVNLFTGDPGMDY
jgi:uncharacterized protein YjdB